MRLKGAGAPGGAPAAGGASSAAKPAESAAAPGAGNGGGEGGAGRGAGGDLQQVLSRLPASGLSDFQKGDAVMIVSTEGTGNAVTAIMVVGGVEPILTAAPKGGRDMVLSPWTFPRRKAAGNRRVVITLGQLRGKSMLPAPAGRLVLGLCILAVVLAALPTNAQTANGSLRGLVTDPSGAAVVGADVQLTTPTGAVLSTKTAKDGTYLFRNLAIGSYSLKAQSKGFSAYEVDGITIAAGQAQKADAALCYPGRAAKPERKRPGRARGALDISNDSNATQIVMKGQDLDALPDDPDDLSRYCRRWPDPPPVPTAGEIYIDGFTGGEIPPKSAIREIRINQNPFSAGIRQLGYGRIEIFTKPGTDKWHGSFMLSGNSSSFNSHNPYLLTAQQPGYHSEMYSTTIQRAAEP